MVDWLHQRLGRLEQRDTAMLHRLLHDIEKNWQSKKLIFNFIMVYESDYKGFDWSYLDENKRHAARQEEAQIVIKLEIY